jgi:transcriptional regulator with XRE-family HTH domain
MLTAGEDCGSSDDGAPINSAPVLPLWAQRIREARERASLTQAQLGRRIGKSQQTLNGYEHGRKPDIPTFRKIALACGVPEIWLMPSEYVVSHTNDPTGRAPGSDQPPLSVTATSDEESPRFAWTINRVRDLLAQENFGSDTDYLFGYTKKLLSLVQGEPDEAKAKEAILRAMEADRHEWRRQLKALRDSFL